MRVRALIVALALLAASACGSDATDLPEDPSIGPPATTVPTTQSPSSTDGNGSDTDTGWRLQEVASVNAPIALAFNPMNGDAYLAEREGLILLFEGGLADGGVEATEALDLTEEIGNIESEQGLLGVAVSPNGDKIVVNYTDGNRGGATTVALYDIDGEGLVDAESKSVLMVVEQPFANHNGGNVTFGPDDMLYIGFGDGGSQGDPERNGQNPTTLLGSLVRIDPLGATSDERYLIPEDNPFVSGGGRPEIVAVGLRNPWRFSFDRSDGDLWLADVGGAEIEEINRVPFEQIAGANFGWNAFEGTRSTGEPNAPSETIEPVFEYDHSVGSSITGGYIYRGSAVPSLQGTYLYSDFIAGGLQLLSASEDGDIESTTAESNIAVTSVAGFGEDPNGELYIVSLEGTVWKVVPA